VEVPRVEVPRVEVPRVEVPRVEVPRVGVLPVGVLPVGVLPVGVPLPERPQRQPQQRHVFWLLQRRLCTLERPQTQEMPQLIAPGCT